MLIFKLFLLFIGGVIVGPMFDCHGSRTLMISGTLIYVLSIMFTSLSTQLYQFVLAQGVMFGIGNTMLYAPLFIPHIQKTRLIYSTDFIQQSPPFLTGSIISVALLWEQSLPVPP